MIGPKELRDNASKCREIDEFLEELSFGDDGAGARRNAGWTFLLDMDFNWLADQFDDCATRMETKSDA